MPLPPLSAGAVRALALFTMLTSACAAGGTSGGKVRTYYIAAEELAWDYTPADSNVISGRAWNGMDKAFVTRGPIQIGHVYKKAVYKGYTDSSFTTEITRSPEWVHLGILGPVIRAEVGDTIRVVFRNRATHPYSVHPHGVFYAKDSEGAAYSDGTSGADKADDGVPPGGTHVYVWAVPERAGPGPMEGSSVFWMYHSHVNEMLDVNAGLIGPMIVTARGKARPDGSPSDVDRELIVLFGEFDENTSWYTDENVNTYALEPKKVPHNVTFADPYYLSNLRETMNGLSFGNLKGLTVRKGDRVRWYLFALTGFEIHAPHWHGQTVLVNHMRTDVSSLTPMEMTIADMVPDNPGTWLFHCHVAPHLLAGMQAVFRVEPAP
jgi:FtsP/CotA-like multicopper oxidase with cupredoxin domain